MNIFHGSKNKRNGLSFELPNTGISGEVFGLSGSEIRNILREFSSSSEVDLMTSGNIAGLMETAPEKVAAVIARVTGQEPDLETIRGIIDLPLSDLKVLTIKCFEASFEGKNPLDFFAGWGKEMGLDGLFENVSEKNQEIRNPLKNSMSSDESVKAMAITPQEEMELKNL